MKNLKNLGKEYAKEIFSDPKLWWAVSGIMLIQAVLHMPTFSWIGAFYVARLFMVVWALGFVCYWSLWGKEKSSSSQYFVSYVYTKDGVKDVGNSTITETELNVLTVSCWEAWIKSELNAETVIITSVTKM